MSSSSDSDDPGSDSDSDDFKYKGAQSLDGDLFDDLDSEEEGEEELDEEANEIDVLLTYQSLTGKKRKRGRGENREEEDPNNRKTKRRKRNALSKKEQILEVKKKRREKERLSQEFSSQSPTTNSQNTLVIRDNLEDVEEEIERLTKNISISSGSLPIQNTLVSSKTSSALAKLEEVQKEERIREKMSELAYREAKKRKTNVLELKDSEILLDDEKTSNSTRKISLILKIRFCKNMRNLKISDNDIVTEITIHVNELRTFDYIKKRVIDHLKLNCPGSQILLKRKDEILMDMTTLKSLKDLKNKEVIDIWVPESSKTVNDDRGKIELKFADPNTRDKIILKVKPNEKIQVVRKLLAEKMDNVREAKIVLVFDGETLTLNKNLQDYDIEHEDMIDWELKK